MYYLRYFLWLAFMALTCLITRFGYFLQITLLIIAHFIFSLVCTLRKKEIKMELKHLLILIPIIFPVLVLFWGTVMCAQFNPRLVPGQSLFILQIIVLIQLIVSGYLVYKMNGFRWLTISFILLVAWYSFWAFFVASMSITGTWL